MVELQKLLDKDGKQVYVVQDSISYIYPVFETEVHTIERRESTIDEVRLQFNKKLLKGTLDDAKGVAVKFIRAATNVKKDYVGMVSPNYYLMVAASHKELIAAVFGYKTDSQLNDLKSKLEKEADDGQASLEDVDAEIDETA